ncbi:Flagellar hook-basal body complex protein FliE [Pseudovibrio axinellae]|uniref:Flagellar hook-basal body complex protein FliE n=1 Tax=Pseudovibrio axinellae TaxID=989403 RepID=A0A166AN99_9HYPH|nr:flagellar hook-basal body complex protein FliE [Pseudovibrio axinellae]KZL21338.1 Flagellar hook-basal body complex protein FliE [Pseudovibrio axinellae]SEQ96682.1 flagellar hook-basal body complex protein FliE [Pseudovibrio axinellae]
MSNASVAASAYANTAKLANPLEAGNEVADKSGAFGNMVQSAISEINESGQVADVQSLDLLQGKANVVDVVTAVAETELALETVVSVRDRVISAYEEIMRMPI